jgi:hypothetical protein
MDTKIIFIYCVCSDFLEKEKTSHHKAQQMTDSEILTFAISLAMFFYGNHEKTRQFLLDYGYTPNILSKSQLNRRLHAFDECFWRSLLSHITKSLMHYENSNEYAVDSFPVSACDTPRITRARIFQGKKYHGKQRYFFGIKVHMILEHSNVFLLIFQRNLLFTEIELITATNLRTFLLTTQNFIS